MGQTLSFKTLTVSEMKRFFNADCGILTSVKRGEIFHSDTRLFLPLKPPTSHEYSFIQSSLSLIFIIQSFITCCCFKPERIFAELLFIIVKQWDLFSRVQPHWPFYCPSAGGDAKNVRRNVIKRLERVLCAWSTKEGFRCRSVAGKVSLLSSFRGLGYH